jgi:hypothetical protein
MRVLKQGAIALKPKVSQPIPEYLERLTARSLILLEVYSPKAEAVREAIAFDTTEADRSDSHKLR